MDKSELRSYGYFLAEVRYALDAKFGTYVGVTLAEAERFYLTPKTSMPLLYKKAMSKGVLHDEMEYRLTYILDGIKGDDDEGTSGNPLGIERQGTIIIAESHWMSNLLDGGELVDAQDVAGALGCTVQNVYKMIDKGSLDGVKFGKKWMVCRKSADIRKRIVEQSR